MKDKDKTKEQLIDELAELAARHKRSEEMLRKNEKRIKDTEAMGRLGYWEFDITTQEIAWSDQIFELYERDPSMGPPSVEEEVLYYSPEEARKLQEYARRAIENGEDFRYDFQVKLPSGKTVYMTGTMFPEKNEYGNVVRLFGTFQDITEWKQVEEALRNEERMTLAIEGASDAVWDWDLVSGDMLLTPGWAKMLGYDPGEKEFDFNWWQESVHPDSKSVFDEAWNAYLEGRKDIYELEYQIKTKSGQWKWIWARGRCVEWDKDGNPLRAIGTHVDITKRKQAEEALRESEEKYRSLFSNMDSGSAYHKIVVDEDGKPIDYVFLEVNDAFEKLTGLSKESIIGRRVTDVLPGIEDSEYDWIGNYGKVALTGEAIYFEQYSELLDRWYLVSAYSPEKEHFVALFHDVTDRKQAEEAVRESEEKFNLIANSLPALISYVDADMHYQYANAEYEKWFSISQCEILGRHVREVLGESVYESVRPHIETAMSGEIVTYEVNIPHSKMGMRTNQTVLTPHIGANGEVNGFYVLAMDITERKQAEAALRKSEEKFRSLFDRVSDSIFIHDMGGQFLEVSRSVCEKLGYSREELLQMTPMDVSSPEDVKLIPERVEKLRQEGHILFEATMVQADGATFPAEINSQVIEYGGAPAILSSVRDITNRKRMEQEVLKVQKLESIGVLAGGIAHDLNNLLTGVLGNISLARMYDNPAEKDRRLAEAEKASMRIKDLTQQLLTFSKGGAPILQTADIAALLRDSVTFTLSGSSVRCDFSIPDDLWPVEVDEGQMNQVINNLVINAKQAMPNGGVIKIRAENTDINEDSGLSLETGAYIKLSVEDEGIGISAEHIPRIFDPFYTTKQEGSGLGLATSYSIIEKHNGYISVESQIEVGTTFHIYLPASPEETLRTKETDEREPIMGEGRVLVMDDEEMVRELATDMLISLGYSVTTAMSGAEAIETYKNAMESGNPFDAVIADLTIPGGMGGKETIQRLLEIDPEVKAIVSSGYSNDPVLANFEEYGFKGVVAKPYKARELSVVLHRVITDV